MKGEMWSNLGSTMAAIMFTYAMFRQYFPPHLQDYIFRYSKKLSNLMYPYIQVKFDEFTGERMNRSEAYASIQNYLGGKSSAYAKRLKADVVKNSQSLVLSMDYGEEITDEFNGVKVWWAASKTTPKTQQFSFYPASDEKMYYILKFHKRDREFVTGTYLGHVLQEGKAIAADKRQRKLYSNSGGQGGGHSYRSSSAWTHVVFEHPATFDTLAMDEKKKQEIKKDLVKFSKGKEYYAKIGKAWKRGYLLYGPPGTGKSTMIAAMANFLNYDVYDLELTTVKNNVELRRLLIETSNKSIIVIEDIDCSLDLTGQREKKKKIKDENEENGDPIKKVKEDIQEKKESEVTLSGLLNFIDGLWSACGGERLIVFTTNHVEKLDPALIRRGRMDKHIEMSYCRFDAFKVLAMNYLDIDSHPLFGEIGRLLEETDMTPADVAENLMLMSDDEEEEEEEGETCLKNLIEALEAAKEETRKKAEEEEASLKAKKEKEKEQSVEEDVKQEDAISAEEVKENGVIH